MALAILAVALAALIRGGTEAATNAGYLRDKTFAHWVALNRLASEQIAPGWPGTGEHTGAATMAGREWHWEEHVEATEDPDIRRIVVRVGPRGQAGTIVKLVGYLPRRGG